MAKIFGQVGSVKISSTEYPVTDWTINVESDLQDVTTTSSSGWLEKLIGCNSATVNFNAFINSAAAESTAFAAGLSVTLTLLVGNSTKSFTVPACIKSFSETNQAKGYVTYAVTAESNGAITLPA